jgi:hypothetical protein
MKKHVVHLEDVDEYDRWQIAEIYFFMKHLRPATSEEEQTDPIYVDHNNEISNEKYIKELFAFLKPYNLSIGDLYLLMIIFKIDFF